MNTFKYLTIIALIYTSNDLIAMKALKNDQEATTKPKSRPESDLSIETPPAKYSVNLLYNNTSIGSAIYQDQDDGTRRIGVFLDEPYIGKNIEPYFEELLQKKVKREKLIKLKKTIKEINPDQLALGNRVISSGSIYLLKNGQSIMSVIYSDNDNQEGMTRTIETAVTEDEFRNRGYGSYLMESFIEKARKDKVLRIELESTPDAIRFYERLGFLRQGNTKKMILTLK